ncbi:MAG TPA: hypothetical protein VKV69_04270 [Actinomycetota bacterium]|nr:hypothetical protein [Actinomycetota bacterium]
MARLRVVYPSSSGGSSEHTLCGFTAGDLEGEMAELRARGDLLGV